MPIELRVLIPGDTLSFRLDNQDEIEQYNLGILSGPPQAIWLDPDNWILKEVEYVSMGGIVPSKPQIIIYPAYPNPFNSGTVMQYFVPEQLGTVKPFISVYDLRGHQVEEHELGNVLPGMHDYKWNADSQSSGTYFIQLSIDGMSYSQKIQLIK